MTHEEKAREIVEENSLGDGALCPLHPISSFYKPVIEKAIASALASAEKKGRDDCMKDNLLLNTIRNEQFVLGKELGHKVGTHQGWNEAIEAARKLVVETVIRSAEGNWLECTKTPYEIAESINKLKRG